SLVVLVSHVAVQRHHTGYYAGCHLLDRLGWEIAGAGSGRTEDRRSVTDQELAWTDRQRDGTADPCGDRCHGQRAREHHLRTRNRLPLSPSVWPRANRVLRLNRATVSRRDGSSMKSR